MEIPEGAWLRGWDQDQAMMQAVHTANEEYLHGVEDTDDLAMDILKVLHGMGFYITRVGKEVRFPTKPDTQ